ncbi:MAG: prepilin-type N-terminal cleavage/methylation domain-containing protein [Phycisphaerales bacterium]|nr:prepilin-type N-terminal cleavage/methylation domain-containing protein [Phycisphaerales bacterium]
MIMTLQHHPARPACRRPGFSLLEIMIAIMIMGLGMVMVATIFPVSLGMARDTVRSDMALVVADAAIATLRARVPNSIQLVDEDPLNPYPRHAILAPNMGYIMQNQPDQIIAANSNSEIMSTFAISGWSNWDDINYSSLPPVIAGEQPGRLFTELTGWPAHDSSADDSVAYVVPAQNIRNDDQLVVEIPPTPVPTGSAPPLFPRLHLADRVYPAPLTYDAAQQSYQDPVSQAYIDPLTGDRIDPQTGNPNGEADERYLLHLLADGDPAADTSRSPTYYSWTAIYCRCSNGDETIIGNPNPNLLVSVVAMHRLSVNARYARQKELGVDTDALYEVNFNLDPDDPSNNIDDLLQPAPDLDPETDMVFPVPWLVMFNRVDLAQGEIVCTAEVARLLPRGSFFVVAVQQEELYAGTPHQVLDSIWEPSMLGASNPSILQNEEKASLKIAPKAGAVTTLNNLAVWVFPPPILTTSTTARESTNSADIQFGPISPVIGVALEVLTW